jgi:micrococcal nuclease
MKLLSALILGSIAFAADIPASDAAQHIGETGTVCGKVAGTRYLENSITFLNFEKPYPETPFTAIIRHENRSKFGKPEETYRDRDVCVTGKIEEYNKRPQIVLTEPSQIKMAEK